MKPIERVPIVQQVADSLRETILSGEYAVGGKLPTEMALCEMLGVGRGTVREALRILQASGYVEIQPGRGAFVAKTHETDIDDILTWFAENEVELKDCMEVRSAVEPLSIRLAIQRSTDGDIATLTRIHQGFLQAVQDGDSAAIARYDEEFHNTIVDFSRNKLLISIYKKVSECIQSFRGKTFQLPQNTLNAVELHNNIMHAITARDADGGEKYMAKHIQRITDDLNTSIRK